MLSQGIPSIGIFVYKYTMLRGNIKHQSILQASNIYITNNIIKVHFRGKNITWSDDEPPKKGTDNGVFIFLIIVFHASLSLLHRRSDSNYFNRGITETPVSPSRLAPTLTQASLVADSQFPLRRRRSAPHFHRNGEPRER